MSWSGFRKTGQDLKKRLNPIHKAAPHPPGPPPLFVRTTFRIYGSIFDLPGAYSNVLGALKHLPEQGRLSWDPHMGMPYTPNSAPQARTVPMEQPDREKCYIQGTLPADYIPLLEAAFTSRSAAGPSPYEALHLLGAPMYQFALHCIAPYEPNTVRIVTNDNTVSAQAERIVSEFSAGTKRLVFQYFMYTKDDRDPASKGLKTDIYRIEPDPESKSFAQVSSFACAEALGRAFSQIFEPGKPDLQWMSRLGVARPQQLPKAVYYREPGLSEALVMPAAGARVAGAGAAPREARRSYSTNQYRPAPPPQQPPSQYRPAPPPQQLFSPPSQLARSDTHGSLGPPPPYEEHAAPWPATQHGAPTQSYGPGAFFTPPPPSGQSSWSQQQPPHSQAPGSYSPYAPFEKKS